MKKQICTYIYIYTYLVVYVYVHVYGVGQAMAMYGELVGEDLVFDPNPAGAFGPAPC